MKTKDQILLEEAYREIFFSRELHRKFLAEAGLINAVKQTASNLMNKVKSMFGDSIDKLLEIVKKGNPELFAKIQQAVQQKDESTLQSLIKSSPQQAQVQEAFLEEGAIIDKIKGVYNKAVTFVAENPQLAANIALAGIATALSAAGPDASRHIAEFLMNAAGKTLSGAAIGGAVGAAAGAIKGGIDGGLKGAVNTAKSWAKKGAGAGAAMGFGSAVGDELRNGSLGHDEPMINRLKDTLTPYELPDNEVLGAREDIADILVKYYKVPGGKEMLQSIPVKMKPQEASDILNLLRSNSPSAESAKDIKELIDFTNRK
jgi:hypothetical protein